MGPAHSAPFPSRALPEMFSVLAMGDVPASLLNGTNMNRVFKGELKYTCLKADSHTTQVTLLKHILLIE